MSKLERIAELEGKIAGLKAKRKFLEENAELMKKENILRVPVQIYTCAWCDQTFTSKTSVFEHILTCKPKNIGIVKETEKLFTCNICGIKLNRNDMKDHARECGILKKIKEIEEKIINTEDIEDNHEQIENWKTELDIIIRSKKKL